MDYLNRLLFENWGSVGLTSEIESRLGRVEESGFVSGVSKRFFLGMRDYLKTRNYWTDRDGNKITPEEEDEYAVLFEQQIRVVVVSRNNRYSVKEVVRKQRIEQETYVFDGNMYSLRISHSEEIPLSEQQTSDYGKAAIAYLEHRTVPSFSRIVLIRHRERTSFNFQNEYVIDMTTSQTGEDLEEALWSSEEYEVECELGVPRGNFCQTLFLYLNALLHRLLTQPEAICTPPSTSLFHPANCRRVEWLSLCPVAVQSEVELVSSEGYDDALIVWCRESNAEQKAILPLEMATQLKWSIAHPNEYLTVRGERLSVGATPSDAVKVIIQSGTIRTKEGTLFHCCEWQYEGLIQRPSVRPVKRLSPSDCLVCSITQSVHDCQKSGPFSPKWIDSIPEEL